MFNARNDATRVPSLVLMAAALTAFRALAAPDDKEPPRQWIEPATGHRVVRLSQTGGTSSFYFHQNGFTTKGDKLVVGTRRGLSVLDWKSREIKPLVEGRVRGTVVGRKTRKVFYICNDAVHETDLDNGKTREIVGVKFCGIIKTSPTFMRWSKSANRRPGCCRIPLG